MDLAVLFPSCFFQRLLRLGGQGPTNCLDACSHQDAAPLDEDANPTLYDSTIYLDIPRWFQIPPPFAAGFDALPGHLVLKVISHRANKRISMSSSAKPRSIILMAYFPGRAAPFDQRTMAPMARLPPDATFAGRTCLIAVHGLHLTCKPNSSHYPTISMLSGSYPLFMGVKLLPDAG